MAIVASNVSGYPEWFPDPEWLFPVGDAPALAGRLIALLSDRELAAEIGRQYYERRPAALFAWTRFADKMAGLLTVAAAQPEVGREQPGSRCRRVHFVGRQAITAQPLQDAT